MRYLMMHKADHNTEAGTPPSPELIAGMGRMVGDLLKNGVLLAGDGLHPSKRRVRLRGAGGRIEVEHGPYAGGNELPAAFTAIQVPSMDAAIDWGRRYAEAVGDVELELGPLVEAWDLGAPRPPGELPLRVLILQKATAASEAGQPLPPARQRELDQLLAKMRQQQVLLYREELQPSARAHRLQYRGGRRSVVDGPFAESKELIGGFVMLQLRSFDEVLVHADRFAQIYGDVEMDVRIAAEPRAAAG